MVRYKVHLLQNKAMHNNYNLPGEQTIYITLKTTIEGNKLIKVVTMGGELVFT